MRQWIRHCVFAAGVLVACAAGGGAAPGQTITPIKESVARLYGNIAALTAYLGVCGVSDSENAEGFAAALDSYRQEVTPLLKRLDTVLRGALEREGDTQSDPARMYAAANRAAVKRIEDLRTKHPDQFGLLCGGLLKTARERTAEFAPLRERFPDEMRMIDEWK